MRALVLILLILIGALISLSVSTKYASPHLTTTPDTASAAQWVTTTDPRQDPLVSEAPALKAPPRP